MYRFMLPAVLAACSAAILSAISVGSTVQMMEGIVIDAGHGKMTVQDSEDDKVHTLEVANNANVSKDRREVRLEKLLMGDWAKITIEKRTAEIVAVAIDARSPK